MRTSDNLYFGGSGLTLLVANNGGIASLEGLQYARNLERLLPSYNRLSDLSPLASLHKLNYLWIPSNNIRDLEPLRELKSLRNLHLQGVPFADPSPLADLEGLQILYLGKDGQHRKEHDLAPLAALGDMRRLWLSNTANDNILALRHTPSLEFVSLVGTPVADLSPLLNLTNLRELDVRRSGQQDSATYLAQIAQLKERGVSVTYDEVVIDGDADPQIWNDNLFVVPVAGSLTNYSQDNTHVKAAVRTFYDTFTDDFDFLVVLTNQARLANTRNHQGRFTQVSNDVTGIGQRRFDNSGDWGSNGRLQGVVFLPHWDGVGDGAILHELMHQWGNYLGLGGSGGHWGFSSVNGQLGGLDYGQVTDLGEGRYRFNGAFVAPAGYANNAVPYAMLELYLVGLADPDEVPDVKVAQNFSWERDSSGEIVLVNGRPIFTASGIDTITIEDIIADHGARVPARADAQSAFRAAVILLIDENHEALGEQLNEVSAQVTQFSNPANDSEWAYNFFEATRGRATMAMNGLTQRQIANRVPAFTAGSVSRSIEENSPAGTPVGAAVTATDPDGGDTLTYGLVDSTDAGSFTIDAATGQIRVGAGADLDFETQALYGLEVTVHDGLDDTGSADGSVDDTVVVSVTLIDVDEQQDEGPALTGRFTSLPVTHEGLEFRTSFEFSEEPYGLSYVVIRDSLFSVTGGSLSRVARDEEGQSRKWLVWFTPDSADSEVSIRYAGGLPACGQSGAVCTEDGRAFSGDIAVLIPPQAEENAAPTFGAGSVSRSIEENSPAGTPVGAAVTATDPDGGDTLTYGLVDSTDAGSFTIDAATGQIRVGAGADLDFETQALYRLEVTVHDGLDESGAADSSVDDTAAVSVTLIDVDESQQETEVPNAPVGLRAVGMDRAISLSWSDPGDDSITGYQFRLRSAGQSAWRPWRDIPGSGPSTTSRILPGLTNGVEYRAELRATNANGPGAATEVLVTPIEVDESLTLSGDSVLSVEENSASSLATYSADDPDGGEITWSLEGTDAGDFTITAGALSLNESPDFERKSSYAVTVKATAGDESETLDVAVTVTDVDEAPVIGGESAVAYEENGEDVVATYSGSDPEGETVTLSLGGTDADSFTLNEGSLSLNSPPDYETKNSYDVTIVASDGTNETSLDLTVTIVDVDEAPPEDENTAPSFTADTVSRSIEENSPAGTPVGAAVTASDPDGGDTITYGLVDGTDAGSFTIDAATGQIRVGAGADLDFETQALYRLEVTVHDGLDESGAADSSVDDTVGVSVTLIDLDESPPPEEEQPQPGTPEAPVNVRAINVPNATLLVWSDPGDNTITGYQFRVRSAGQSAWRRWRDIAGSGPTTTTQFLYGLTEGVEYRLELRATNAGGAGEATEITFTP